MLYLRHLLRVQLGPKLTYKGSSIKGVQRSTKKFFCFAKHDPGSARQKQTQPGKGNLADLCILGVSIINNIA